MAEFDQVAIDVLAGAGDEGAVMFECWLGPLTDTVPDSPAESDAYRLFTDPQFLEWLEVPAAAILHQIPGTAGELEGRSFVWVKREARIKRCQSGCAYQFLELEAGKNADDPTATRPRGYP